MKSVLAMLVMGGASGLLTVCITAAYIFHYSPNGVSPAPEIRVEQGDTLGSVARKLRAQKVIANERLFLFWAKLRGVETRIHLGIYRFENPVPAREILERLATGRGLYHKVTVPEGLTVKEVAALLGKMEIADAELFLAEASSPELLSSFGLKTRSLEGYLFPSTYYFTPGTPEKKILLTMVEQFRKVSAPVLEPFVGTQNLTFHELITLASIIEKETGIAAERPLVSAVFHNRLKLNMPLQSDPTVIYGLKDFQGDLTRKHLQDSSPFNTYRVAGLPPGPICNPGLSSIKAAVEPADVPYLYFVSRNDGSHQFSENLEAHNRAVNVYQPVTRPPPRRHAVTGRR